MNKNFKLSLIGFIQLSFVAANTFFIAKINYPMIFVSAIFTNLLFSYAVKVLAFSCWKNKIAYSIGCSLGCVTGTYLAVTILKNL